MLEYPHIFGNSELFSRCQWKILIETNLQYSEHTSILK